MWYSIDHNVDFELDDTVLCKRHSVEILDNPCVEEAVFTVIVWLRTYCNEGQCRKDIVSREDIVCSGLYCGECEGFASLAS